MTPRASPAWVSEPVDMDGAARALGISRRTLIDTIKALPHYELRGRKKVFYPEHIASLRRDMHQCASKSNGPTVGLPSTAPALTGQGLGALSRLKMLAEQRKSGRS